MSFLTLFDASSVVLVVLILFLAITLIWLLNTDRTPKEWRNKPFANVVMVLCALTFLALAVDQVRSAVAGVL